MIGRRELDARLNTVENRLRDLSAAIPSLVREIGVLRAALVPDPSASGDERDSVGAEDAGEPED